MKLNCNVIHDLLPLYVDQICSDESRELVDEHLTDCRDCSTLLQQIRNTEIETDLKSETENVILHQAKFFKQKSTIAGAVIAGIFMIPILVCLIVNLASGAALNWFFIVFASLITAASLIVVPLMMPENKLLWTFCTFTVSLLLLFGVICIYTHGSWFFVVSSSVLFGFSVCFLPFAVYVKPLKSLLGRQKGLTVMTAITLLFVLMMLSIGLYSKSSGFWRIASAVSLPFVALAWLLFLLIRYSRFNGLIKAGICTILIGTFSFFADNLINAWIGIKLPLPTLKLLIWNTGTIDGNVKWLLLLGCTFAGIILFISGISKRRKQ
ncbi:MAG: zf-HC2 domain-containing protein [Lachnospiraceae bacterium]|nr:zf-HC2 domain-containing protein [Lachnospiraceae bacterium]